MSVIELKDFMLFYKIKFKFQNQTIILKTIILVINFPILTGQKGFLTKGRKGGGGRTEEGVGEV